MTHEHLQVINVLAYPHSINGQIEDISVLEKRRVNEGCPGISDYYSVPFVEAMFEEIDLVYTFIPHAICKWPRRKWKCPERIDVNIESENTHLNNYRRRCDHNREQEET
jgi:hypothetical protein